MNQLFLQVIAFADALLNCEESGIKKVLVLCPVNTVNNWKIEFLKWIPILDCEYGVSEAYMLSPSSQCSYVIIFVYCWFLVS